MRLVVTNLAGESASLRRCDDTLQEQEQFGRDSDAGKENPCAIEEAPASQSGLEWESSAAHAIVRRHTRIAPGWHCPEIAA
jgi:hypothetical protein